jgi:hypothetical protein
VAADRLALGQASLTGVRVGISVSQSAELGRLGLTDAHLRLALAEIARVVIRAGGVLVYGGHLQPDGYTAFLEGEVDRYAGSDRPLQLVVPWAEHRRMTLGELRERREALSLKGQFTYLDAGGVPVSVDTHRGPDPASVDDADIAPSLTALRRYLTDITDARVLLGGKEEGYQGDAPGIIEEALLAIEAGQPIYLAGGFGGATATVAHAACRTSNRWPPREPAENGWTQRVVETIAATDWRLDRNGLSDADNRRLAATHRPSEAASLVASGLARAITSA